eukprot:Opistho-1_new@73734
MCVLCVRACQSRERSSFISPYALYTTITNVLHTTCERLRQCLAQIGLQMNPGNNVQYRVCASFDEVDLKIFGGDPTTSWPCTDWITNDRNKATRVLHLVSVITDAFQSTYSIWVDGVKKSTDFVQHAGRVDAFARAARPRWRSRHVHD